MITASVLERLAACPASAALPRAASTSEHAERGTAIHAFLAAAKTFGRDKALATVPEIWRPVCEAIDLEALPMALMPEASYAYNPTTGKARFLGSGVSRDYARALPGEVCGTADVVGIADGRAFVADYKTGWSDVTEPARNGQLRFLALCVSLAYADVHEVVVEIIRIREDGAAWRASATLDALDLSEVANEVARIVPAVDDARAKLAAGQVPDVAEGPHCRYCPAMHHCPAKVGLLIRAARGEDVSAPFLNGGLSRDMVGSAYVLVEQLRGLAKELDKRIHAAVDEFGECPTPRGTVLKNVVTPGNERIDGNAAAATLRDLVGKDAVEACAEITVTKKSLGAGLRRLFGKEGPSKERRVLEILRQTGGITRTSSEKLVEVAVAKERTA